jgi:hypothetical protein
MPDIPLTLRAALVKQVEDHLVRLLALRYSRRTAPVIATGCANTVVDAIEELLTLHPDAEALRTLMAWWLRQFEEQGIEPCFCIYHAETGERTDNPHCPRHSNPRQVVEAELIDGSPDGS